MLLKNAGTQGIFFFEVETGNDLNVDTMHVTRVNMSLAQGNESAHNQTEITSRQLKSKEVARVIIIITGEKDKTAHSQRKTITCRAETT